MSKEAPEGNVGYCARCKEPFQPNGNVYLHLVCPPQRTAHSGSVKYTAELSGLPLAGALPESKSSRDVAIESEDIKTTEE